MLIVTRKKGQAVTVATSDGAATATLVFDGMSAQTAVLRVERTGKTEYVRVPRNSHQRFQIFPGREEIIGVYVLGLRPGAIRLGLEGPAIFRRA